MKLASNGKFVVIPGGGGASEEVYSTEETRIGTWIDGKPLYKITFYEDLSSASSTGLNKSIPLYDLKINGVTKIYGTILPRGGTDAYPINLYINTSFYVYSYVVSRSLKIYTAANSYFSSYAVTIEYTKTTDTATVD